MQGEKNLIKQVICLKTFCENKNYYSSHCHDLCIEMWLTEKVKLEWLRLVVEINFKIKHKRTGIIKSFNGLFSPFFFFYLLRLHDFN